jgi:biopolymer transport protein TolR
MSPMSGRGNGRRTPMAEINVTPLVDVMLVLLIIFMITAPLMMAGVPVHLPDSRAKSLDQDQKPLQVSIDESGHIFIDDKPIADGTLGDELANAAKRPDAGAEGPQIFLRADRGLDYGRVMQVMGEINHAGLRRVALVTTGNQEK